MSIMDLHTYSRHFSFSFIFSLFLRFPQQPIVDDDVR